MRRIVGGTLALALLCSTFVGVTVTSVARAQDLVESDPAVVRARQAVNDAEAAAHAAADQVTKATQERDDTQASIDDHVAKVAELDQERAQLAAQRDALEADLRERAASLYRQGGSASDLDSLLTDDALDAARRQQLGDIAAKTTLNTARKLQDTRDQLGKVQDTLRGEEATLRTQKAALDNQVTGLEKLQADMDQKVAAANAALAQARAIGALRLAGEPVMGPSLLTANQLVAWYQAQGYHPHLAIDIADLAQIYIQEGTAENVRGDFAFAQSIVETAGFSAAPDNNYSGIGWCDSCSTGNKFPTPRDGVRAQIQLLFNYADSGSRAANLHNPLSPYLYGSDPVAAARKFDTFFAKGWAPTWSDMGHGNWATAPNYADAVIGTYHKIQNFA
jgi:peptidoglycan hydrolase CwlO-like protein